MYRKLFFTILIFGLLLSSALAQTKKLETLKAARQQYLKEIKALNALLFSNQKKEKSVITHIEDINYRLSIKKNLIKITNEQANLLTKQINANQKEITSLRAQLQELKDDYAAMIVKSYKSKSEQSKVMFLLSSDNFKQAYKRLQYIKQYANYQKKQAEIITAKTKKLQDLNITLSKQKEEKQSLIEENRIIKIQLEDEEKQRKKLIASIRSNMSKYSAQIKQRKQETEKLDREINRLIKASIAASRKKAGKKTSTGKFVLTPESKKLAKTFELSKGKLGWPVVRGVIKGKYGKRRSLTDHTITQNYKSIYIATEDNAEIKAIFNGEVSGIHIMKRGNPTIIIRHGNYFSVYMNLSEVIVKKGDKITTGQVIGTAFTNKIKGETLLGFRIYKNDQVLNPEFWLAKK